MTFKKKRARPNLERFAGTEYEKWANIRGIAETEAYFYKNYLTAEYCDRKDRVNFYEAGTGSGRILFALYKEGFRNLIVTRSRRKGEGAIRR